MKRYSVSTLRELYRVDNKYWHTGGTDLLDKRLRLGKEIDEKYRDCILSLTALTTRTHKPLKTLIRALELYGYKGIDEKEEAVKHETN